MYSHMAMSKPCTSGEPQTYPDIFFGVAMISAWEMLEQTPSYYALSYIIGKYEKPKSTAWHDG